ncbi:hypothetical protein TrCOL_g7839 [Triparma columacea]|uniref:Heme oxygenase n=1 Tax=Triparma columacea TaxID=722753 RepID=A0A9W7G925_9STRA|nr:hypothetical protein TrCOL_g7839 [Triparma columacea]
MDAMMSSIRSRHSRGNMIGFLKLPLIFTSPTLYAGAIAQFYLLTLLLESGELKGEGPMFRKLKEDLALKPLAPGYASDLSDLLGPSWSAKLQDLYLPVTLDYASQLKSSSDSSLCSALFILYGALVIGGGRSTQKRVKKVPALRGCGHVLFDVDEDMMKARGRFRKAFDELVRDNPEEEEKLVKEVVRWMGMNNKVVMGIKCTPTWLKTAVLVTVGAGIAWIASRRVKVVGGR